MKVAYTIFCFLFFQLFSFSQTETLNQLNENGKKDGKWILYLDKNGNALADSIKAKYWRYTYYDNGIHIYPMGAFIEKGDKIIPSKVADSTQSIQMLDGEYTCAKKNGRVKFIHEFKNGEYVSYKEFHKSGIISNHFDYTKHCDNQIHSWYMYLHDENGKILVEECIKKDENGNWPTMKD